MYGRAAAFDGVGFGSRLASYDGLTEPAYAPPPVVVVLPTAAPLARTASSGPSGGGGGMFVQTWWSLPDRKRPPAPEDAILAEGELIEEISTPLFFPTVDLAGLSSRVAKEADRSEVQAWGKPYRKKPEKVRATEMLEATRQSYYEAKVSSLSAREDFAVLLAAGYTAAGLHAAVVAHGLGFAEDVLVAVFVDKAWAHADPFHGMPLGRALPYTQERFATVPRIPDPVVLTAPVTERVVERIVEVERFVEVPVEVERFVEVDRPVVVERTVVLAQKRSTWAGKLLLALVAAGLFAVAWAVWRKKKP